ncbi:MAG: hypothetical protein JXP73_06920 [Deltaproteobacteria bacterium]|jgi:hypothetical protein|nr:hypothetical protein [Deltaproteobacteria bacterium]
MRKRKKQAAWSAGRQLAVAAACAVGLASLAGWAASRGKLSAAKADDTKSVPQDAGAPTTKPDTVRILIHTVPPRKARVKWGPKTLGTIPAPRPLVVERPRDSGPLDLVIRAAGYLPVHTRAYTFTDSRVAVKLTPPSEKNKLFGYREEPPTPDGGVPGP